MFQLLDVVEDYIPSRRIPDTSRVIPKPTLPDSLPSDSAHAIASADVSSNTMQLADVSPIPDIGGISDDRLLWTILVVLCALCLCIYFAKRYGSKQQVDNNL